MDALHLLILALATLYAAHALTKTHGPFGVFTTVRDRLPLGGLTTCFVCATFWLALGFWALWQTPAQYVVTVFAVAGGAVLAAQYVGLNQQG